MNYSQEGDIAVLTLDDGKANAVGHSLIDAVDEALNRADKDAKALVIAGRPGVFSAGFDLKEFKKGPEATTALVNRGGQMLLRLFSHPQPIIAACSGHAIAAGAFMLLASDTRIGVSGEFKIGLNETAIGMTLPVFGLELAKSRLSKRHQTASFIQANLYDPVDAVDAGFLDEVVAPEALLETAIKHANQLAQYPVAAYGANKLLIRQPHIDTIRASLTA